MKQDLICLEEINHSDFYKNILEPLGYEYYNK